jgi:hypothetical protein
VSCTHDNLHDTSSISEDDVSCTTGTLVGVSGTGWLTDEQQRAWRAYQRMQARLAAALNRQVQAESGLSLPDYEVLVQLTDAPDGRLRPFELQRVLEWSRAACRTTSHECSASGWWHERSAATTGVAPTSSSPTKAGTRSPPRRPGTSTPSDGTSSTT